MAIDYIVRKIQDNGLETSAYDVRMKQNGEYKRAELIVARGADANQIAGERIATLWAGGETVSAAWFVAARERSYIDYYKGVQLAVQGTLAAGGTLAQMNAAGLAALGADDSKLAEWNGYKTAVGATSELEIHNAMMLFTIIGRQAAGG